MRVTTKQRTAILMSVTATVAAMGFTASADAATPVSPAAAKRAVESRLAKTTKPAKVTTVKCVRLVGGSARCEVTQDYGYRVCRDTIVSVRRSTTGSLLVVGLAPTCKAGSPIVAPDDVPETSGGTNGAATPTQSGGAPTRSTGSGLISEGQADQLRAQKAMYGIRAGTVALDMSRVQYDPAPESGTGPNGQSLMAYYWVVVSGGRTVAIDVQYRQLDATGAWVNAFAVRSVGGSDDVDAIDNFM
jgi:hypothetical protein